MNTLYEEDDSVLLELAEERLSTNIIRVRASISPTTGQIIFKSEEESEDVSQTE